MTASVLVRTLLAPIRFYQRFISPGLPATCRFYPTCSAYAVEALQVHGAARGSWLAVRRLSRCHPWHQGGMDPVPPARERKGLAGSSGSVDSAVSAGGGTPQDLSMRSAGVTTKALDVSAKPLPATVRSAVVTPAAHSAVAKAPNLRSNAA